MFTRKPLYPMIFGVFALIVLAAALPACAQEVRVGAGAAPTENIFSRIKEPMEKATGLKLILVSNGPVEAFKELDKGQVDAASGGIPFSDWISLMEKEGYVITDKSAYKSRVIGKDIVKVIVHKKVSIKTLTREQLKGIFTGSVSNWQEVGGPDLPIKIVFGSKIPGTNSVFQKQIMDEAAYSTSVVEATTAAEVKEKVASTPGAVGLAPISIIDASIFAPKIPEVGRPITLITKGAPSPVVLKMLDFIAAEGQKYVAK